MIVPSMNRTEITAQVRTDFDHLKESSIPRLVHDYDKERKRLKISKEASWPQEIKIKTAAKNNWLVMLKKLATSANYRGIKDCHYEAVVYYYTADGINIISPLQQTCLEMFYAHFFTRYNQRLNLGLTEPLDKVKAYYRNGGTLQPIGLMKDGVMKTYTLCNNGIALGFMDYKPNWLVHKTFIAENQKRDDQREQDAEVIAALEELVLNNSQVKSGVGIQTSEKARRVLDQLKAMMRS